MNTDFILKWNQLAKKIFGFLFVLLACAMVLHSEQTIFSYTFKDSSDTYAMVISEEENLLVYSDSIAAEAFVVHFGEKDLDRMKSVAFECKLMAKQPQNLSEYRNRDTFKSISSKLIALGKESKISYGELNGYMKITELFTPNFLEEEKTAGDLSAIKKDGNNKLVVLSFTDELDGMINKYFQNDNRYKGKYDIEYSLTTLDQFPNKLDSVLASGSGCPDVFALEDAFVRKYVESGLLLDLTDIYNEVKNKMINYPAEVGACNGKVYALSWQVTPGALFYRRSLAKKYLGTDDPAEVQKMLANWDGFIETAELLKEKSDGDCYIVSSTDDMLKPYLSGRKKPWVVNDRLVIDPIMDDYMVMCKTLRERGLEGGVGQWSEGWFAGMKGVFRDDNWDVKEVFCYFLPTWGLHYVLKTNAPGTSGDWAMIQGPASWNWGGTWIGACAKTKNSNAAKEFIRYIATDDTFLEQWAKDTGDVVSNAKAVDRVKGTFSEPFLGGQNHYAEFAEMAKNVNGKLSQRTDQAIEGIFGEEVDAYVNGEKSKEQALADFKDQVAAQFSLGN